MDAVPLEKAPTVAIYAPPKSPPWDDAVTLALTYAGIPFTTVWDDEVLAGDLKKYDWVHLHHEDFTGQFNKLYINYRGGPVVRRTRSIAIWRRRSVTASRPCRHSRRPSPRRFAQYVERGGFLFAMCGATETLDLAIAGRARRHRRRRSPMARQWIRTPTRRWIGRAAFAFRNAHLETSPIMNSMSDIDGHQVNVPSRKQPLGAFTLFAFSAKFDPVASMLVQDHRNVIPDFYGVTTSFTKVDAQTDRHRARVRRGRAVGEVHSRRLRQGLVDVPGRPRPRGPAARRRQSVNRSRACIRTRPGYRLILNNVLFPAAKKKPLKT